MHFYKKKYKIINNSLVIFNTRYGRNNYNIQMSAYPARKIWNLFYIIYIETLIAEILHIHKLKYMT